MTRRLGDDPLHDAGIRALAQEMTVFGHDRDAPARAVMAMLGDRWTTLILLILALREIRHADLKRVIEAISFERAISQRVLTMKLRALERDGFVLRTVTGDVPPRTSYRLSDLGFDLAAHVRAMIAWINSRAAEIHHARTRYEQRQATQAPLEGPACLLP